MAKTSRRTSKAEILGEAVVLATASVRSSVKNLLIVRALRDGADFDEAWWLVAVRNEFEVIAHEHDIDADRVEAARKLAKWKDGRAQHPTDYRFGDAPTMKRRVRHLRAIAARLRALATDDDVLRDVIHGAQQAALDEIASARRDPVERADLTSAEREVALGRLFDDLEELAGQRAVLPAPTSPDRDQERDEGDDDRDRR